MTYSNKFHRLVIYGNLYGDIFNTTLAIGQNGTDQPIVTQAQCDAVAAAVSSWWSGGASTNGPQLSGSAILTGVKLNRIGLDGKYSDPVTVETIYGTPVAGIGTSGIPPQLSIVATLRTAVDRGYASKGRMYFPPANGFTTVGTDGTVAASAALRFANAVSDLVTRVNATYSGGFKVGVTSKVGSGAFHAVNDVSVGRIIDTMRSRRSKGVEAPVYATTRP